MPTYAQLGAESWWNREIVTPAMDWLGDELCRRTGRPRTAAGTKGDNRHLRGAHRSQEWILRSAYCTSRAYTVQTGLTAEQARWISGFDFTPGSAAEMIAQSKRLLAAMKAGLLDEVLEFFGNVDGDRIADGWDNLRDRAASSDSSHLWHWHISIDRRHCNNRELMERILAIALGLAPLEDDMPTVGEIWSAQWGKTTPETAADRLAMAAHNSRDALAEVRALRTAVTALAESRPDADTSTILARMDALAGEERERDQAAARERGELAELVRAGQSGQLAADEVLRRMGELLTAGTGDQGQARE